MSLRGIAALGLLGLLTGGDDGLRPGRALFHGPAPLVGRIAGHDLDLPSEAIRCRNCHLPSAGATGSFGPPLDARSLRGAIPRRGGPPSRYDARSFCRLLRTGVDPAQVLVDRTMPRYQMEDATCEALWSYLTSR